MKKNRQNWNHYFRQIGLAAWITTGLAVQAQSFLWEGHTDVGIAFEANAWNLHIGQHEANPPMEYAPSEAILGVDVLAASSTVPDSPQYGFLGTAGSLVWVLPQVQDPALLFLGIGTEELPPGLFVNDEVTLSLRGVRAPGQFSVYTVSPLGKPTVVMNSGDGITGADSVVLPTGGHQHMNWAFGAPGTYEVDFEAAGILADGNTFTSSGPVTYTFSVSTVPEPSTLALLALGGIGLVWRRFLQNRHP